MNDKCKQISFQLQASKGEFNATKITGLTHLFIPKMLKIGKSGPHLLAEIENKREKSYIAQI